MSSQAIGQRFRVSRGGCWQPLPGCRCRLAEALTFSRVAYNVAIVASAILVVAVAFGKDTGSMGSETASKCMKWVKRLAITSFVLAIVCALVLAKKDMMLIVAGGAVGEFVQNDEYAKQIPADVTEWLHKEIRESIADTTSVKP